MQVENKDNRSQSRLKGSRRVVFSCRAEPGQEVYLAASFNGWNPRLKRLVDRDGEGSYSGICFLPRGRHEYKFVVDGIWRVDPRCRDWTPNDRGSINSVIIVD